MADLQGRKVFKVFNQDFIVDERYTVTKELGQGAYGIVWYVGRPDANCLSCATLERCPSSGVKLLTTDLSPQRRREQPDERGRRHQEGHQCF